MKRISVCCAAIAGVLALSPAAGARNLYPSDPYDARVIAAYNCDKAVTADDYSAATLARCKAEYDTTVAFERSVQAMTPAQKSTLAIAKGLSMLTMSGGYTKLDGVLSARACKAVEGIDQALTGYDPAAPNGLENIYDLLVKTRDAAIPKCRMGGHWPG